jgi:hypothetical protein
MQKETAKNAVAKQELFCERSEPQFAQGKLFFSQGFSCLQEKAFSEQSKKF